MPTRAQFVGGEHVLSSFECRDDTEHRENPNCARADLTGNSRGSSSGKNPHRIRRTCGEVSHVNSNSSSFSLRISLHVAQLVALSVSVSDDRARMTDSS